MTVYGRLGKTGVGRFDDSYFLNFDALTRWASTIIRLCGGQIILDAEKDFEPVTFIQFRFAGARLRGSGTNRTPSAMATRKCARQTCCPTAFRPSCCSFRPPPKSTKSNSSSPNSPISGSPRVIPC
jgi:hypothetical protein